MSTRRREPPTATIVDLGRLHQLASAFRRAIEQADREKLSIAFREFPHGSCGETALLLGTFLKSRDMGTFQYVCGWCYGQSHAWLEKDGLIIDITADSFSGVSKPVIVTYNSVLSYFQALCPNLQGALS